MSSPINWANILTSLRILLLIPITFAFISGRVFLGLALYIVAALTDLFDGMVARRLKLASVFGAKLDAGSDIFFSLAIFWWLFLLEPSMWILHFAAIFIAANGLVGAVSLWRAGRLLSLHLQPGRVATAAFFVAFPIALLFGHALFIFSLAIAGIVAGRLHSVVHIFREYERPA